MNRWLTFNVRHPLWRVLGVAGVAASVLASVYFAYLKPGPLAPSGAVVPFSEGKKGSYTEQLDHGRFTLAYETMQGDKDLLRLGKVLATLEEPQLHWQMVSPLAEKKQESWLLHAPLHLEAKKQPTGLLRGKGDITAAGPGLVWEKGLWSGLAPLRWEDMEEGPGKGIWQLPAGWRRELDGRFVVEKGPITWHSTKPDSQVHTLQAQKVWAKLEEGQGLLEQVDATLQDGTVHAARAEVTPTRVDWFPPITFQRNDGWMGDAQHATALRPLGGKSVDCVELQQFRAHRTLPPLNEKWQAEGPPQEAIQARGVHWTPAGLRLEGEVVWEQPMEGLRLVLKCPRVFIREAPGADLPEGLPVGEAWADGNPVLSWGQRTLTSPRMEARRSTRTWRIQAPVYGRSEWGTFSGGAGYGSREKWRFEGPIKAQLVEFSGHLRGDSLDWDQATWTITGRPATLTSPQARLAGEVLTGKGGLVVFPRGISGAFLDAGGDLTLRADRGEYQEKAATARLQGRVECKSRLWRMNADDIVIELGPGRSIKRILAKGSVFLKGSMGEGWGESLLLDLSDATEPKARWDGKVRGVADAKGE